MQISPDSPAHKSMHTASEVGDTDAPPIIFVKDSDEELDEESDTESDKELDKESDEKSDDKSDEESDVESDKEAQSTIANSKNAIEKSYKDKLRDAISRGAERDALNLINLDPSLLNKPLSDEGQSALTLAAESARPNMVDFLLRHILLKGEKGVDYSGALLAAALTGHASIIKKLLKAGADPLVQTKKRRTALTLAAGEGYLEAIDALLGDGRVEANGLDGCGDAPFVVALRNRRTMAAKRLLPSEFDYSEPSYSQFSEGLALAVNHNLEDSVEELLSRGPDLAKAPKKDDHQFTIAFCEAAGWGDSCIISMLGTADVSLVTLREALLKATFHGRSRAMKTLIPRFGPAWNPGIENTLWGLVGRQNHGECVREVLRAGSSAIALGRPKIAPIASLPQNAAATKQLKSAHGKRQRTDDGQGGATRRKRQCTAKKSQATGYTRFR